MKRTKKLLTLALAALMLSLCFTAAVSAAAPNELAIDLATDVSVLPTKDNDGNDIKVGGSNTMCGTLSEDKDKIVFEANGTGSTEQYPRAVIKFNKQVASATYKWMTLEVKFSELTLNHYQNGASTTFTPHIKVGYVASDVSANPDKLVEISTTTGSLLTTSTTFEDDYVNKTFDTADINNQTVTMLIQLPDAAADGYSTYINTLFFQPSGWACGITNHATVEITAIKFYDVNPYAADAGDNGDDGNTAGGDETTDTTPADTTADTTANTTADTKAETTADTSAETEAEKSGCGSVIGGSVIAVAAVSGVAVLVKKKKED